MDQGYTTENPSFVHLNYFETADMKEAEDDLKQRVHVIHSPITPSNPTFKKNSVKLLPMIHTFSAATNF